MLSFDPVLGHLVGDYLLQNDWMAAGKKRSSAICAVHCGLWSLSVWLFAGWPAWTLAPLFVTHFLQDRTAVIAWWMDTIGQGVFKQALGPWSVIVVDNTWHLVAIWAIGRWVII